jgi:diguanylate cyclase (GGDEF)-like protein
MTDQLTGLLNARSFREAGYRLLSDPATSVGVLFMDLNGFKPVNDRFGHHAGDHLLRTIARRMSDSLRHQDICARLGGDEFAVWLPGATTDTLERRKHHLRAQLSRPIWWQVDGGPSILLPRVEAAIGAASAPVDGSDVETLLACADQRMYADKPAPDAATRRSG